MQTCGVGTGTARLACGLSTDVCVIYFVIKILRISKTGYVVGDVLFMSPLGHQFNGRIDIVCTNTKLATQITAVF